MTASGRHGGGSRKQRRQSYEYSKLALQWHFSNKAMSPKTPQVVLPSRKGPSVQMPDTMGNMVFFSSLSRTPFHGTYSYGHHKFLECRCKFPWPFPSYLLPACRITMWITMLPNSAACVGWDNWVCAGRKQGEVRAGAPKFIFLAEN